MGLTTGTKMPPSPSKINMNETSTDLEYNKAKQPQGTASIFQVATHLFKGSVGAGLFAMGDCFKNGGLVCATLLLPIIAVIAIHCERMLIAGSIAAVEKTPGATFYDYPETVEKCLEYGPKPLRRFSKLMKLIVEIFLCVVQFGFCSIYFVFITENVHQVVQQNGINIGASTVMLITLLPVMIPSLMTSLKHIAPVSMFANCALMFGLLATLTIALTNGPLPAISERNLTTNGSQMSLFFGTALFAYEGISLILPIRNSMREPNQFTSRFGVLNVTLIFVSVLFVFTGFVSYLRWGEDVKASITLNLEPNSVFSQVIKVVAALGVFFGYPIQFMVMIKIIWVPMQESYSCLQNYPDILEALFRFVMVLTTFGVAIVVPKLGLFISLIGALCATSLTLVIPVFLDFIVKSQVPKALTTRIYLQNITILFIGILGILSGTYQSIVDIVKGFNL